MYIVKFFQSKKEFTLLYSTRINKYRRRCNCASGGTTRYSISFTSQLTGCRRGRTLAGKRRESFFFMRNQNEVEQCRFTIRYLGCSFHSFRSIFDRRQLTLSKRNYAATRHHHHHRRRARHSIFADIP